MRRGLGLLTKSGLVAGIAVAGLAVMFATPQGAGAAGTWALVSSPNQGTSENQLNGVACTSGANCWAVGFYLMPNELQTLIERWDGTAWTIVPSPNQLPVVSGGGMETNQLNSVSCVSANDCWAVGSYQRVVVAQQTTVNYEPLFEHWDGATWTLVDLAVVGEVSDYFLNGVSCISASNCQAVGYETGSDLPDFVFTVSWNGVNWTPNPPGGVGRLNGVSCVNASNCWGVGFVPTGAESTLIQKWDGSTWTTQSSPNQGSSTNHLNGVSCTSTSSCWATGFYLDIAGSSFQNLFEVWNGSAWTVNTNPASNNNAPTQNDNQLRAVVCLEESCWAAGDYRPMSAQSQTLIDRGPNWSLTSSPNANTANDDQLNGITCADANNCFAVGFFVTGTFSLGCAQPGSVCAVPQQAPGQLDQTLIVQFTAAPGSTPAATAGVAAAVPVPATGAATTGGAWSTMVPPIVGVGLLLSGLGVATVSGRRRRPR